MAGSSGAVVFSFGIDSCGRDASSVGAAAVCFGIWNGQRPAGRAGVSFGAGEVKEGLARVLSTCPLGLEPLSLGSGTVADGD